ncbi:MAG: 50S ribosomal protein L25/general stress protein Ctc [Alphaproteobacteria bacterium]|nr:50S ribosomal protein L25/general stress protein Ctc [Alphaproteobacteria bacterium]MCD8570773.1 50S ribosomal protein L25/general stress protein Ctc [Alphaproteobacteria bacterium]
MSKHYALQAEKREKAGKGAARSLRREGKIPAVIYGDKKEPVTITLDQNKTNVEYYKGHMFTTLCDINLDGAKQLVLARDVQKHPVTDVVEHVDFLRVTEKTMIAVMVPVHFINHELSPSIKNKGTLNVTRHEVEVICQAQNIPESIEVNLEGKEHGDSVRAHDAALPSGAKFVIERDFTIATLLAPKTAAQEEAEEAAAAEAGDGIVKDEDTAKAEGEEAKEE